MCKHTDIDQALTGTWCSPKLEHVVALSNHVLCIYQVYQYLQNQVELFTTWLKLKEKARSKTSAQPRSLGLSQPKKRQAAKTLASADHVIFKPEKLGVINKHIIMHTIEARIGSKIYTLISRYQNISSLIFTPLVVSQTCSLQS